MRLDFGNGDVEVEVSFWTLVVYEQQFGSDMIGDLFGKVDAEEEPDGSMALDYTKYNWTASVQALWSGVKAADRFAPAYEDWCKSVTDVNMWPLIMQLKSEVLARLFRTGEASPE